MAETKFASTIHLPSAQQFISFGAHLPGSWGTTGKQVEGYFLIDTGAERTLIAQNVVDELGLEPVDARQGAGANGKFEHSVFVADLVIRVGDKGTVSGSAVRAGVIPDATHRSLTIDGKEARYLGVVGRDILSKLVVTIDGPNAKVTVEMVLKT